VIDFVDQETLALELLRREDVRAELSGQIDLVLVDEFQDTSPIQLAIFLELASLARESIWVGDPKQAIYSFRGTDPGLMDAAIESLTSTTVDPDLVNDAAQVVSGGRVETLGISYRSRPGLVALTSEIFGRAFAHHGMPEERTRLQADLTVEPDGLGRSIEYWPLDLPGPKNASTRASALAAGVRDLLARGDVVRDRDSGSARPQQRSDVAILCRTNKQCQEVAEALGGLGIPAVVPRMGLLDTAEGQLLVAGLRLWVDPADTVAAAELCRFVSCAENLDALVARTLDTPGGAAFRDDPTVAAILAARARLGDLGPVAAIDAVLAATDLRRLCAGWGNAAQRMANLDALRGHATLYVEEAAAGGDAATLVGLLRHLDTLIGDFGWDKSRADSQALLHGEDAVTVSTWHRAKGLEWPATILFGLEGLRDPQAHGAHVMSDRELFNVADPLGGRWIRFWPNPYANAQQNGPVRDAFEASPAYGSLVTRADREALRVLYVGWTRARDRLILAAERGKLVKGLLAKLCQIDASLIREPDGASAREERVSWAGMETWIGVGPRQPAVAISVPRIPGTITLGRRPEVYPRARQSPSELPAIVCSLGEIVTLGERIALRAGANMEAVGNAFHSFLAADRPRLSGDERRDMAASLLMRFGVARNLECSDLLACASRLWGWLEARFPGARLHREWPVALRHASGTVVAGTADLLVRTPIGVSIIDHKTFPGIEHVALDRALAYSGQLAAYAAAIRASIALDVTSLWIHFPVLGRLVEVHCADQVRD
jgi:ATP-dependent exoDNAse (exonuclease V) beta subunit